MTEYVENLVLESLRALRNEVASFRSEMKTDLGEAPHCLT